MRGMIELGPTYEVTTRITAGCMTVGSEGRSAGLLGPYNEVLWVLLGHEGLAITYLCNGLIASIGYLNVDSGSQGYLNAASVTQGNLNAISANVNPWGIDALAVANMTLNGAEVLQWQQ